MGSSSFERECGVLCALLAERQELPGLSRHEIGRADAKHRPKCVRAVEVGLGMRLLEVSLCVNAGR